MIHRHFHIEITDEEKFLKDLQEKPFTYIDGKDIWEIGYDTNPFCEVTLPPNYPDCCPYHRSLKKNIEDWYERFPNCCDNHKNLLKKNWFEKKLYSHIPDKVMRQLGYAENFFDSAIDNDNWYKEITDYFDYTMESFGTPNIGGNDFFKNFKYFIEKQPISDKFPKWKRKQLLEFLNLNYTGLTKSNERVDINKLYDTFQKWLATFPSLPYFIGLKETLENKIPMNLILHDKRDNRFSETSKFKVRTKGELIEILVNITKSLLSNIDTPKLLKEKSIDEQQKFQIDILNEHHRITQTKLLSDYSKKEGKYIKIVNSWLKNEKKYFKELQPIINEKTINNTIITNIGNGNNIVTGNNNEVSNL